MNEYVSYFSEIDAAAALKFIPCVINTFVFKNKIRTVHITGKHDLFYLFFKCSALIGERNTYHSV